jgi:hypothetical protein
MEEKPPQSFIADCSDIRTTANQDFPDGKIPKQTHANDSDNQSGPKRKRTD